jgi:hypothetical protein
MSILFIVVDSLSVVGFLAGFYFAFRYYTKTKFQSALGILYYTLMSAGLLWSLSLVMSDFYNEFSILAPWFFAFLISMMVSVVFVKGSE